MLFLIVIMLVLIQRVTELFIAKRNEKKLRAQGAYEVGAAHYPYMLALHCGFFISLITEVLWLGTSPSRYILVLGGFFVVVQMLRVWCLASLGSFWNTKIIILPSAQVVKKGPYQFLRHPNYMIVCLEIVLLPLMFSAYITAVIFTLLNVAMLRVRIPVEERALIEATNYEEKFMKST